MTADIIKLVVCSFVAFSNVKIERDPEAGIGTIIIAGIIIGVIKLTCACLAVQSAANIIQYIAG